MFTTKFVMVCFVAMFVGWGLAQITNALQILPTIGSQ